MHLILYKMPPFLTITTIPHHKFSQYAKGLPYQPNHMHFPKNFPINLITCIFLPPLTNLPLRYCYPSLSRLTHTFPGRLTKLFPSNFKIHSYYLYLCTDTQKIALFYSSRSSPSPCTIEIMHTTAPSLLYFNTFGVIPSMLVALPC